MNTPDPDKYPEGLVQEIAAQCERTVPPDVTVLVSDLRSRFPSAAAIILYGSCLRSRILEEGVVDLYVIVNSYREAYSQRHLRLFNAWLPPNVFYAEVDGTKSRIRFKYAVISLADFRRGCSAWYHPYLWSRFAQPVRLLYSRDTATRDGIYQVLAGAVMKFLETTIPSIQSDRADPETIWINGLSQTYAAELRPEGLNRARYITHQNLGDFIRLTRSAEPGLGHVLQVLPQGYYRNIAPVSLRRRTLWQWRLRRWQGRGLSVLRLMKAVFTFSDCVDYAAWKIKRHTGITIKVTPRLQRHPILFGFSILWQLIRRNALH